MNDFDKFWTEHENLIKFIAGQYAQKYNVSTDLMMQSARIALALTLEKPREHVRAYFLRAARGKMNDDAHAERGWKRLRKGRLAPVPQSVDICEIADYLPDESVSLDPDAETVLRHAENLPERQRNVVRLYFWEGLLFREIGEQMGIGWCRAHQILKAAESTIRKAIAA